MTVSSVKLKQSSPLLNTKLIRSCLDKETNNFIKEIYVFSEILSTNTWLMKNKHCNTVCLAEKQMAGRGRRHKNWYSPKAKNIYLSFAWCFDVMPSHLSLLSLMVAIALADALKSMGLVGHGIKWPNDLYWQDKKMAGILLERNTRENRMVIGIGVNVNMPVTTTTPIDQPWVSLSIALGKTIDRNQLVANILCYLNQHLQAFSQLTFTDFTKKWQKWDILRDQKIHIIQNEEQMCATVMGINEQGCLKLRLADQSIHYVSSAEIMMQRII